MSRRRPSPTSSWWRPVDQGDPHVARGVAVDGAGVVSRALVVPLPALTQQNQANSVPGDRVIIQAALVSLTQPPPFGTVANVTLSIVATPDQAEPEAEPALRVTSPGGVVVQLPLPVFASAAVIDISAATALSVIDRVWCRYAVISQPIGVAR